MIRLPKKLKEDDSVKIKNIYGIVFQLITYDDIKKNNSDEDEAWVVEAGLHKATKMYYFYIESIQRENQVVFCWFSWLDWGCQ